MVREVVEVLNISPGGTYVDATVGLGGHAEKILSLLNAEGRIIGIDRDDGALTLAKARLADERVILKKGKFSELKDILGQLGVHTIDGVFFDFGVSMMQFREPGRGFSFHAEEPLDMRMDGSQRVKAEDIVNAYPEAELERIFRDCGEERLARRIAKAIGAHRVRKRISTCTALADIVSAVYRRRGKIHPATKVFQALRIAVNDEMAEIEKGLAGSMDVLHSGGRLCTISYHSLEDRRVKHFIRDAGKEGLVRIITKKPLSPSYDEVRSNPSARSAKLRGAERL
jgi:16S rRNA (cytosine1402-N4)-methyltransferase